MSEEPPGTDHSAAASVLGYLHQTRWGLLELLRARTTDPDRSLTLEMHDDIAWEQDGEPSALKQLKLHVSTLRNLTDASDDMWRTLRVWMDNGRPRDPYGPTLTLITNSSAGAGSAAALLRDNADRDVSGAVKLLENAARDYKAKETLKAREQFLKLTPAEQATFVGRIYVADQSEDMDGVDLEVAERLRPGAPTEQFDTYMDLVWAWWARTSIEMLKGRRGPVKVAEVLTALERIRDQFTRDNLPILVEDDEIDIKAVVLQHDGRPYVRQLEILELVPRQLHNAILDYQRAYLQDTRWLDVHLVDTTNWRNLRNDYWMSGGEHSTICAPSYLKVLVRAISAKPVGTFCTRWASQRSPLEIGFRIRFTHGVSGTSWPTFERSAGTPILRNISPVSCLQAYRASADSGIAAGLHLSN